jgi:hypothetical protein
MQGAITFAYAKKIASFALAKFRASSRVTISARGTLGLLPSKQK